MAKATEKEARRMDSIKALKKLLKPGSYVYTTLAHVSSSGMSRVIGCYVVAPRYESEYPELPLAEQTYKGERDFSARPKKKFLRNEIVPIHWHIANILSYKLSDTYTGLKVTGCGMDMGFHVVYALGANLWPKGTPKPHGKRNGEADSEGGYALKHSWL